jgi:hypothetical protein
VTLGCWADFRHSVCATFAIAANRGHFICLREKRTQCDVLHACWRLWVWATSKKRIAARAMCNTCAADGSCMIPHIAHPATLHLFSILPQHGDRNNIPFSQHHSCTSHYICYCAQSATCCMAAIAQLAARRSHNPKVVSSILTRRICFPGDLYLIIRCLFL